MLTYAMDNPAPGTIILVSSDGDFSYAVSTLRLRRYHIIVVGLPAIHQSLKAQASLFVNWNTDVLENPEVHCELPIKQHDLGRQQLHVQSKISDASPPYHYSSTSFRSRPERFKDDSDRVGLFGAMKDPTPLSVRAVSSHTKLTPAVPDSWKFNAPNFSASAPKPVTDFRASNTGGDSIEPLVSTAKLDNDRFNHIGGFTVTGQTALLSGPSIPLSGPGTSLLRDGALPLNPTRGSRTEFLPHQTQGNLSSEFNALTRENREEKARKSFTSTTAISHLCDNNSAGFPTLSIRGIANGDNSQDSSSTNKSVLHCDTSLSSTTRLVGEVMPSLSQASPDDNINARHFSPPSHSREVGSSTTASIPIPLAGSSSDNDNAHTSNPVSEEISSADAALAAASPTKKDNFNLAAISHIAPDSRASKFDIIQMGASRCSEGVENATGLDEYAHLHTPSELRAALPSSSSKNQPVDQWPPTVSTPSQSDTIALPPQFEILVQELRRQLASGVSRPSRSTVAIEIKKQDPLVYERAGVTKFKEYSALAVQARVVVIGGIAGDAWISLPCIPTANVPSERETVRSDFRYLIEQLQIARHAGVMQPLRSVIGQALITQCKSLYQDTGFPTFKEYVAAAENAGIVRLGGNNGHAWVSLICT